MPEASDQDLLIAFADRADQRAFTDLVVRHAPLVHAACRRRLGGACADDAAQAVFLLLARKARMLARDPRPLAPWLFTTAGLVVRNQQRADRRRQAHERNMPTRHASDSDELWLDVRAHIDAALDDLPEHYRAPLVLHYLEGRDRSDLTEALGLSAEALKKRLSRGLDLLRTALARRGVAVPLATLAALMPLAQVEAASGATSAVATTLPAATGTPSASALTLATASTSMSTFVAALTLPLICAVSIWALVEATAGEPPSPAPVPVGEPAQAPPLWQPQRGTSFWYVSLVEWRFVPDVGTAEPPAELLPSHLVTAFISCADVLGGVHRQPEHPRVRIMPVASMNGLTRMEVIGVVQERLRWGDGELVYWAEADRAPIFPAFGQVTLSWAPDQITPVSYHVGTDDDVGPILLGLGVNDFIHPLPAGLTASTPKLLADRTIVTWHPATAEKPMRMTYTYDIERTLPGLIDGRRRINIDDGLTPMQLDAVLSGTVQAEVGDDGSTLPAHAITRAEVAIVLRQTQTQQVAFRGRLVTTTTSFRLDGVDTQSRSLSALPAVAKGLARPEAKAHSAAWANRPESEVASIGRQLLALADQPPTFVPKAEVPADPPVPPSEF